MTRSTRIGVVSDVHGNITALRVVIDRLRREGAERFFCAGDLVGYGPHPNECVELLTSINALCVAGNHDLFAIGRLPPDRFGTLALASHRWTDKVLGIDTRQMLEALPLTAVMDGVVIAHGSLRDVERYVDDDARGASELAELRILYPEARLLVLGHTHRPWLFGTESGSLRPGNRTTCGIGSDPHLMNPGSVGQSRQREQRPKARCALLDLSKWTATFYAVNYDVGANRRALRSAGLPARSDHLAPTSTQVLRRRAARLFPPSARWNADRRPGSGVTL